MEKKSEEWFVEARIAQNADPGNYFEKVFYIARFHDSEAFTNHILRESLRFLGTGVIQINHFYRTSSEK
jgi:hypothetical protein